MQENVLVLVINERFVAEAAQQLSGIINEYDLPYIQLASNSYLFPVAIEDKINNSLQGIILKNKDFFLFKIISRDKIIDKYLEKWIRSRSINLDGEDISLSRAIVLAGAWARSGECGDDYDSLINYVNTELSKIEEYDMSYNKRVSKRFKKAIVHDLRHEGILDEKFIFSDKFAKIYRRLK